MSKASFNSWRTYVTFAWIPALLSLITFIVYYPSLWYGFFFDDLPTITNYIHVRSIDFWGQFFQNPRWISRLLNQTTFYYWKTNPFAYRIFDVLLHIAIGVLVFFSIYRLLSNVKRYEFIKNYALELATTTTILFLLHPAQTQTVSYITQMRLEGLVALFSMLVLITFVYAVTTPNIMLRRFLYGASFIFIAFAGGTKEIIIVLPILLVMVDWFLIAESDWSSFKSRIIIHACFFIILYGVLLTYGMFSPKAVSVLAFNPVHNNRGNVLTSKPTEYITCYPFAISQFKVLLHYITIFIWPFSLCFDNNMKLSSHLYDLDVILPLLLLLALLCMAVWLYIRYKIPLVIFGLAWFFIAMLPRTSIFPTTELICDYKTYLASLGMMVMLAFVFVQGYVWFSDKILQLVQERQRRIILSMVLGFVCIAFASSSSIRNNVWRSELDFWGDVINKIPEKSRAYNNYAIALWETGRTQEAMDYFYKSIERDNFYAEPHINLATIYQISNNIDKALEHYKRALDIGEAHPELFHNLGMLHFTNQSFQTAEYCLKQAIQMRPFATKSHTALGKLYQVLGRKQEAFMCLEQAINGDAPERDTFYLYGSLALETGQFRKAIDVLEKIDKHYQDTAFLLGCCYYNLPSYTKAVEYLAIAYQKDPNNYSCAYNYAQALLNTRKYDAALAVFDRLGPTLNQIPYARLHRAKCLYEVGRKQDARKALAELITSPVPQEVKQDARTLQKELKLV